ncbi:MAG: hypothetical protein ACI835_001481 [Planctomycetota bacterium]|jgi:hypothetical protein
MRNAWAKRSRSFDLPPSNAHDGVRAGEPLMPHQREWLSVTSITRSRRATCLQDNHRNRPG